MRRFVLAAAVALAACSVKLEGAPCTSDANCPGQQGCGADGKCTQAAAACPGTAALVNYPPPPSLNCQPGQSYCGDDATIVTCSVDTAVCSHFPSSGGTSCGSNVCDLGPSGPACRPRYYAALSFNTPAAGAVVGPLGVDVTITLTLSASSVPVPATLELQGQGMTMALGNPSQNLLAVTYSGRYVPAAADAPVELVVTAAQGTVDEISTSRAIYVDTAPPAISGATITCSTTPCLRSSTLTVTASVSDSNLATVEATVSLAPSSPIVLSGTSGTYSGTFSVKSYPFPYFSTSATAQVTATDLAGNSVTANVAAPVQVTRLRWATQVESTSPPSLAGAAIDATGTIYLGGANGTLYVLAQDGSIAHRWPVGTATSIVAAPAVGTGGVWVANQDAVYLVNPGTGAVLNGTGCATGGPATTPAIAQLTAETAFVGSQNALLFAIAAPSKCTNSNAYEAFYAAPAIDGSGNVYAASSQGRLRSVKLGATGFFVENWPAPGYVSVGASVRAPLAFASAVNSVWSASFESAGKIYQTSSSGTPTLVTTSGSLTDPILLSNGDVVVGDGNVVQRWNASGVLEWASPDLGAAAVSVMALANGDAVFVVPTAGGAVYALKSDGSVLWQYNLTGGTALAEGNVFQVTGDTLSTAVFGAANGTVYGVLLDGGLDAGAPWPKVHHDTRNTANAATSLP